MSDADETEAVPGPASPADQRRRARLAQIEAEQQHGRQLVERYGRDDRRPRFAFVGRAETKQRRR